MKVKDLIIKLQSFDPEIEVCILDEVDNEYEFYTNYEGTIEINLISAVEVRKNTQYYEPPTTENKYKAVNILVLE